MIYQRVDPGSGWELTVYAMMFGNVRLCVGEPGASGYHSGWCYQARFAADALRDAEGWDGRGVPPGGWYRDLQTGETRPPFLTHPPDA